MPVKFEPIHRSLELKHVGVLKLIQLVLYVCVVDIFNLDMQQTISVCDCQHECMLG